MVRVFVISLKRATERRAHMAEMLGKIDLAYELFDAYDGRDLSDSEPFFDKQLSPERRGEPLTKGELGCAMSHRAIYEKMIKENIDRALILEDDVELSPSIVPLLSDEKFLASTRWDWLQIDYGNVGWGYLKNSFRSAKIQVRRKPSFVWYFIAKLPYLIPLAIFEQLRDNYHRATKPAAVTFYRPLYLASAYMITRRGAEVLLDMQTPVAYVADRLPNVARRQRHFIVKAISPLMAYQDQRFNIT